MRSDQNKRIFSVFAAVLTTVSSLSVMAEELPVPDAAKIKDIKAYCLDFNWAPTRRRGRPFAKPGTWAGADPAQHVEWYKNMGANVIQTFCVSCNGYAWYKGGIIPEQPGLKHDFLTEVVKLGHQEGMLVMGYFCIASNPKWGTDHPDMSYGTPSAYHIPYTDEYLDYLAKSIKDAVTKTGIDGFMIDWLWMPNRKSTDGAWLDCEKALYKQLMGEPFPGKDKLSSAKDNEYSRKAIDRCWKAIRKAAKEANPECVIWVTVNKMNHPHVINSDMYREADWLMNEAGSMKGIEQVKGMVGEHTRLITCMALWNGQDAAEAVPEALEAGVGLYGFTTPRNGSGLVPLDDIFAKQVCQLSGDSRNIAVLARAYRGMSAYSLWKDGKFTEPDVPPPFKIRLKGRGRGMQDTASISYEKDKASVTVITPYGKGRAQLVRIGKQWPSSVTVLLQKRPDQVSEAKNLRMANGTDAFQVVLEADGEVSFVKLEGGLDLGREWRDKFPTGGKPEAGKQAGISVSRDEKAVEITIPRKIISGNPETLALEWD